MGSAVMEYLIRSLGEDDVPQVVAMEQANQIAPWSETVFRDELAAENRVYLVADQAGVVGFGGVMLVGDEAHVTNLLVSPGNRSLGVGLHLMIALIDAALTAGARHLTLEVRSGNHPARSLYARLGLAPVGVRKGYYGVDDALILWAHDIDSEEYRQRLDDLR
ncbi:MAG TPA: ribosomal protein S18-alanine N-acetyltransferase [Acidimicrobiia bacterium]